MISLKQVCSILIGCLLCLATVGCVSTKYVEQKQYLFTIKTLPEKKVKNNNCSVFVDHVTAVSPFDQLDFLYRIKSGRYLTDYYNGFLVSPTEQLEAIIINYLKASGNFNIDSNNTSMMSIASDKLKVQITELYADYRDNTNPKALVALRFILTRSVDDKSIVVFDKVFYGRVSIKEKNTASLLAAWNIGLQDIIKSAISALNATLAKNPCVSAKGGR